MRKTFLTPLLSALLAAGTLPAWAADDVVRIGVLNDQSGLYSDFGGATSVIAARMAGAELVFREANPAKWAGALRVLGIDPVTLSGAAGRA